ncbi:hypothetical protein CDL15_Pgr028489 [Punica granatum]|uniref:RNase H type-1 domain-containing protein n=1 Tax=Punica granatum TaxID=22663 RepID=A0A218VY23_PUNGR|nr:hypothetical protein CDL15_Pgr028489 [Punica granatum]
MDAVWRGSITAIAGVAQPINGDMYCSWRAPVTAALPFQVEARAILTIISLALNLGWSKIWLELDALVLTNALICPGSIPWDIKNIVLDISMLLSSFSEWHCTWVP